MFSFKLLIVCCVYVNLTFASNNLDTIIAIGDIHGDIIAFKKTLRLNGIINDNDEWICGSKIVIQMGDLIDRGKDDKKVLEFAMTLEEISKNHGGKYIQLLGNHEIMNLENDFRYAIDGNYNNDTIGFGTLKERIENMKPESKIGQWLREKSLIYKWKNDTIFVHGGISNIDLANIDIDTINDTYKYILKTPNHKSKVKPIIESVLWDRNLSLGNHENSCTILDVVLKKFNVKRMVVGHTITSTAGFKPGEIGEKCGGKIVLTDVGMSNYYKSIPFTGNIAKIYELD